MVHKIEFKLIPIEKIKLNNYNPNEMDEETYNHLKQEIQRVGFIEPINVRPEKDYYIVINGEHRFKVASDLKIKKIPCIITNLTEKEAKLQTINLNKIKGSINPIKFAFLLQDLNKQFDQQQIQKFLKLTTEELEAYKLLITIPDTMPEITITPAEKDIINKEKETIARLTLTNEQVNQLKKQFPNYHEIEIFKKINYFYIPKTANKVEKNGD